MTSANIAIVVVGSLGLILFAVLLLLSRRDRGQDDDADDWGSW